MLYYVIFACSNCNLNMSAQENNPFAITSVTVPHYRSPCNYIRQAFTVANRSSFSSVFRPLLCSSKGLVIHRHSVILKIVSICHSDLK